MFVGEIICYCYIKRLTLFYHSITTSIKAFPNIILDYSGFNLFETLKMWVQRIITTVSLFVLHTKMVNFIFCVMRMYLSLEQRLGVLC